MESAAELWARIGELRVIREKFLPPLRRALSLLATDDLDRLPDALRAVPAADLEGLQEYDPVYRAGRLTDLLYLPFSPLHARTLAVGELIDLMIECERAHGDDYQLLLDSLFLSHGLTEHRRRVIDTAMACISAEDALTAPLVWEHVEPEYQERIDDFRVMRDDFETVGRRYQDIFELTSRTLAYLGLLLNLRHRQDSLTWADGRRRTIDKILNHTTAHTREFIVDELPLAKELVGAIDRRTRNQIGHRLTGFDFRSQTLVDDHGNRVNYLLFLQDYLEAVRITQYLLIVVEKLTLDRNRARTPQREYAGLPIGR